MQVAIDRILETMFRSKAEVCWLTAGEPPKLWIENRERQLDMEPLRNGDIDFLLQELVSDEGRQQLAVNGCWRHEANYGTVMRFGFSAARAQDSHVIALRRLEETTK